MERTPELRKILANDWFTGECPQMLYECPEDIIADYADREHILALQENLDLDIDDTLSYLTSWKKIIREEI